MEIPVIPIGRAAAHRSPLRTRAATPLALQVFWTLCAGAAPALLLALLLGRFGRFHPLVLSLALLTLGVNVRILVKDLRFGLAMFIVATGLSPKLPGFYNNLRVEDAVFVLVFVIWLLQTMQRGWIPAVRSPIVLPYLLLTLMSILSTAWGFCLGTIPDAPYSFFLQAKRIEYFLIFWITATTVRNEAWLRLLTLVFVASGALAALYGLAFAQNDNYILVADRRVTGPEGENYNTLSGYLVLCIGVGLAAIRAFRESRSRVFLIGCTAVAGVGLLLSFSREGYIMLMGSLLVFGFTKHRWILLGAGLALAAAILLVEPVRQNLGDTVHQIRESRHADPGYNSLAARYQAWEWRWKGWFVKQPLIGNGVGSVALSVDNEYLMRACEVGIVGFVLFAWWLTAIWRQMRRLRSSTGVPGLLALGLASGFVGLLIQGMVAAAFTTIRTMEPFWFLLGLVSAAGLISQRGAQRPAPSSPAVMAS